MTPCLFYHETMRTIILTGIVLLLISTGTSADTIVLNSGERIQTQGTWEENGWIRYFKDGVIADGFPKAEVQRIESGTSPPAVSPPPTPVQSDMKADLGARLERSHPPKNPVETAGNATVSIHTAAGSGSGFFITSGGYILTNRHVIEGDEKRLRELESQLDTVRERLEQAEGQLKAERQRIDGMVSQMESDPAYDTAHNAAVVEDARRRYRLNDQKLKRRKAGLVKQEREFSRFRAKLLVQHTVGIELVDGTKLEARIEKISRNLDLALLKLPEYRTPYIRPADLSILAQGDRLFAIGNPLNFSHAVSAGVFSGHQRGMLMTSAPINAGNSGGPLVTAQGEAVGINTMKIVAQGVEGIGFAIPIQTALAEFRDFLDGNPP